MRRIDFMVGQADFAALTAAQFMQQDVVYFTKLVKAQSIAAAITTGNFGSVPIVDGDLKPVGIVSEYDLLKAMRQGKNLGEISAGDIMTKPAITVPLETSSGDIMKVMEDKHLIRVAVVDQDGKLVGMLARRDLMKGYLQSQVPDKVWWM